MKGLSKKEEEEIKENLSQEKSINREVTILWDGSSFSIKLPKDFVEYFGINEKNRLEKSLLFKIKESSTGVETTLKVVPRTKKRKIRKNVKTTNKK